jgi:hypothetical protein
MASMPDAPHTLQPPCVESGCDRPAAVGDARCELHQSRLGPLPRAEAIAVVAAASPVLDAPPASALTVWRDQRFPGRFGLAAAAIATVGVVIILAASDLVPSRSTLGGELSFASLVIAALVAPAASFFSLRAASTTRRKVVAAIALSLALAPWLLLGVAVLG